MAALGVGFVASVFLNVAQHQRAQQERKLLQGEITDLRYQVTQDKLALEAAGPTPTPTPSPSASPLATPEPTASPSPSPAAVLDAAAKTTTVKDASVQPNLRAQPSSSSRALINRVPAGTTVTLVDDDTRNGYRHVTINGQTGYILASHLN